MNNIQTIIDLPSTRPSRWLLGHYVMDCIELAICGAMTKGKSAPVGTLKNVRISDVVANVIVRNWAKAAEAVINDLKVDIASGSTDNEVSKARPIMIPGRPDHSIENVLLENVKISNPGKRRGRRYQAS